MKQSEINGTVSCIKQWSRTKWEWFFATFCFVLFFYQFASLWADFFASKAEWTVVGHYCFCVTVSFAGWKAGRRVLSFLYDCLLYRPKGMWFLCDCIFFRGVVVCVTVWQFAVQARRQVVGCCCFCMTESMLKGRWWGVVVCMTEWLFAPQAERQVVGCCRFCVGRGWAMNPAPDWVVRIRAVWMLCATPLALTGTAWKEVSVSLWVLTSVALSTPLLITCSPLFPFFPHWCCSDFVTLSSDLAWCDRSFMYGLVVCMCASVMLLSSWTNSDAVWSCLGGA